MLAYEMDGQPLPRVHGAPLRLVIPEMYGYKNVKWVERITLARDGEPRLLGAARLRHGCVGRWLERLLSAGYVRRFSLTERALHWVHASAFFALLATGLVLYVPYLARADRPPAAGQGNPSARRGRLGWSR